MIYLNIKASTSHELAAQKKPLTTTVREKKKQKQLTDKVSEIKYDVFGQRLQGKEVLDTRRATICRQRLQLKQPKRRGKSKEVKPRETLQPEFFLFSLKIST